MNGRAEEDASGAEVEAELELEIIACDGCGRMIATEDGPGMIAIIKGPCPDCGGCFRLEETSN
jgi:hypothetical protein